MCKQQMPVGSHHAPLVLCVFADTPDPGEEVQRCKLMIVVAIKAGYGGGNFCQDLMINTNCFCGLHQTDFCPHYCKGFVGQTTTSDCLTPALILCNKNCIHTTVQSTH